MQLKRLIDNHEYVFSFIVILLVVTIFNLHNVFGPQILLSDDNARYFLFVNDVFTIPNHRSITDLLWLHVRFIASIFSTYSVEYARLYVLLIYMIPLSCLLYVFNRKILELSQWVALASAVVINIIPRQYQVPAFLEGSYTVTGMLAFVITLIVTEQYLNSSRYKVIPIIAISIGWLLTCDLMNEMGVLLFPAYIYLIYSSDAQLIKKLYLYLITSLITVYRIYIYFHLAGTLSNKPADHSLHVIANRIVKSIDWWLPVSTGTTTKFIFVVLMAILVFYIYIKSKKSMREEKSIVRAYIFYGIWFLSCSFPFWFLSQYFSPRYFYISYIALTTITFITVYQALILPTRYRQQIATISIIIIFSLYGAQRYLMNADMFNTWNKLNSEIYSLLSNEIVNKDTQISLVNINTRTGGYYIWSSGYLQYLLKMPGVRGIIGDEYNFYDPFNLEHCGYRFTMSCLDTSKELIAYKKDMTHHVVRMNYFLQWKDKGKRDSDWSIYKTNNKNRLSLVATGSGIDNYRNTLSELNLSPDQVLWGNYNDKKSLETRM